MPPDSRFPSGERPTARAIPLVATLGVVAIVIGVLRAVPLAWTSDDAYISFRYARHLVEGLGLVFNAGERVEGYTNFLWTLWCALGLRLGLPVEAWAAASSIACFAATIALLARFSWKRGGPRAARPVIPLAALGVALHPDAAVFATSGLETALFTLLAVAGYVALAGPGGPRGPRRAAGAATLLGLACLTRPDGVVFAALGGGFLLFTARPRLRAAAAYAAVLGAIGIPFALWKLAFYGDLLPNTYYAKSAMLTWWDQGWTYAWLYFSKYPVLVAGPLLVLLPALLLPRRKPAADRDPGSAVDASDSAAPALLATAFSLAYTLYVTRVGGDFMFARLLIPATPFYLIAAELGLAAFVGRLRPRTFALATAVPALVALASIAGARDPFEGVGWVKGIVNERGHYQTRDRDGAARRARELRDLTRGLPVRAVIVCEQAIAAYYSEIPVVLETCAGLTDSAIAHQSLSSRSRPGHEKKGTIEYTIDRRRAHLYLGFARWADDALRPHIPLVHLRYRTARATLMTWDPTLMAELRRRGASFEDYPAELDRFIERMPGLPDSNVADTYARAKRFYFSGVNDPRRETHFLERLARTGDGAAGEAAGEAAGDAGPGVAARPGGTETRSDPNAAVEPPAEECHCTASTTAP